MPKVASVNLTMSRIPAGASVPDFLPLRKRMDLLGIFVSMLQGHSLSRAGCLLPRQYRPTRGTRVCVGRRSSQKATNLRQGAACISFNPDVLGIIGKAEKEILTVILQNEEF